MNQLLFSTLFFLLIFLSSCSGGGFRLPGVYRIDIQQGNVIDQEMIDRLRPGMHKDQVYFILGTPAITDPFHTDQWDYIYSMAEDGKQRYQRHLRIYFEDDRLAYIEGDVVVSMRTPAEPVRNSRTVEVPADLGREGFFSRITGVIPFLGEHEPGEESTGNSSDGSAEEEP